MIAPFVLIMIIETGVPQINNPNMPIARNPTQITKLVSEHKTSEECQNVALKLKPNGQLLGAFCSVNIKGLNK